MITKRKIYYVVPEYQEQASTHFAYLIPFLEKNQNQLDIHLLVEKGQKPKFPKVRILIFQFLPLRFLETLLRFLYARWFCGIKDFYVHYSFLSAWCAHLAGARVFYWNCGEPWKYTRGFWRASFEKLVYKKIDYLVTGTQNLAERYSFHYHLPSQKIKILPNWIDFSKTQDARSKSVDFKKHLNLNPNSKIILFVHRLSKRKGAHLLAEIARQLISLAPNLKFQILIIGTGPEHKNIISKIEEYGLIDNVKILGPIPNSELTNYYSIADAFIMPSEEEGFPHVLLESMAFGVPFVASDVGGVKDIVPEVMYNYLIPPGNISEFTTQLKNILDLPTTDLKNLKNNLQSWVKRYDIAEAIKIFQNLFNQ